MTTYPLPDDFVSDPTILRDAFVGHHTGDNGAIEGRAEVPLYQNNIMVFGPKGSGTSNMLNLLIANASARQDSRVWLIDPEGFHARQWLNHLLHGEGTVPAIDWVATTMDEAAIMAATAAELATARQDRDGGNLPFEPIRQIVIVVASGAREMGYEGDSGTTPVGAKIRHHLSLVAAAGDQNADWPTNVNVIVQVKQLELVRVDLLKNINYYIGMAGASETALKIAFGGHPPITRGEALIGPAAPPIGDPHRVDPKRIAPFYQPTGRIAELARTATEPHPLTDPDATCLGGSYEHRWERTLTVLLDGQPIPARLARLGAHHLGDDLSEATPEQIEHALYASPSVTGDDADAAVQILAHSCNGKLIKTPDVLACMTVEVGVLFVRWDSLRQVASRFEAGVLPDKNWHPDAGIMLRLAAHLATGGLTDSSRVTLAVALNIDTEDTEPA